MYPIYYSSTAQNQSPLSIMVTSSNKTDIQCVSIHPIKNVVLHISSTRMKIWGHVLFKTVTGTPSFLLKIAILILV